MRDLVRGDYLILALAAVAWCVVHSAMISSRWTAYLRTRTAGAYRYYRLAFNAFALLSLVAVIAYERTIPPVPVFAWEGPYRVVQLVALAAAAVLFVAGAREYDLLRFAGIRQIRDRSSTTTLANDGGVHTAGILGLVRHPWYTGALLVIWARPLNVTTVVVNVVFTAYLVVGTYLEEAKLVAEFGDAYRAYQREVGMFFPIRWPRRSRERRPG